MTIDRRSWGIWKFMLAGVVGALAIMLAPRLVFGPPSAADIGTARVLIVAIPSAIGLAWAFAMAVLAFQRMDEFQQEAAKFAWYWGGSLGLAVSSVAYAFIGLGGLHWLDPAHFHLGREIFRAFQLGYFVGLGCPVLGFIAVRLWWQVAKR